MSKKKNKKRKEEKANRPQQIIVVKAGALDSAATSAENAAYWAFSSSASADEIANPEVRRVLRSRCRYEYLNDGFAQNAARTLAIAVTGTGPRLQVHTDRETADKIENAFHAWATSIRLAQKLDLAVRSLVFDGEIFFRFVQDKRVPDGFNIELVDAGRVTSETYGDALDENELDGIRYDEQGNPESYTVARQPVNPMYSGIPISFEKVPAEQILHLFIPDLPGQHRGLLKGEDTMNFEHWLTEKGFNPETLDEANKAALQKVFEAETKSPEPTPEPKPESQTQSQPAPAVQASGLSHCNISNLGTASVGSTNRIAGPTVIEASLLMSSGIADRDVEKLGYDQRIVDQAVSRENRGMGLQALFHSCIRAAGMYYPGGKADNDLIRTAFEASEQLQRQGVRASAFSGGSQSTFSSVNLPGILSNVANKALLNAYNRIDSAIMQIADITSGKDFKTMSRFQMAMGGELKKVEPTGELEHVDLSDEKYENQIETCGALVALTRHDIINDDLDAFLRIPKEFGRKAATALERAGFIELLSNLDTMFNTTNKNIVTGQSVFSFQSLDKASKLFMSQKEKGGSFILSQPTKVLLPPALYATGKVFYESTTVNETTPEGAPSPVNNPWYGRFKPIVSPYWGANTDITDGDEDDPTVLGSDSHWLVLTDPQDIAVLEVAFLNGQRNPIIESGEMDFNLLGMAWRCYFDFGVAVRDKRGGVYGPGLDS